MRGKIRAKILNYIRQDLHSSSTVIDMIFAHNTRHILYNNTFDNNIYFSSVFFSLHSLVFVQEFVSVGEIPAEIHLHR